jgi:hypothetical protein
MEKLVTPDEELAQIRRMSVEDREYVEAELMRDAYVTQVRSPSLLRSWRRSFVVRTKPLPTRTRGYLARKLSRAPSLPHRRHVGVGRENFKMRSRRAAGAR